MEINKIFQDNKTIYKIIGRLDTQSAPDLQDMLDFDFKEAIQKNIGELNLILDFEKVEYLSSAGLRTILYAQKKINATPNSKMAIINASPDILEIFEMTGFVNFVTLNPESID